MKIVFFGSSCFAVEVLKILSQSKFKPIVVITPLAKTRGRNLKVLPAPVEEFAKDSGLNCLPVSDVNSKESLKKILSLGPDICISIAFGQIFKQPVLEIPKNVFLNVHASMLPVLRGPAPVQHSILNGDTATGITIQKVCLKVDAGDILLQKSIPIGQDEDALLLAHRLSRIAGEYLIQALDIISLGRAVYAQQDDSKATYAPKIRKIDGLIDWNKKAVDIYNKVRALVLYPCAWTIFRGKILKIWKADVYNQKTDEFCPGTIVGFNREGFIVRCADESIRMKEVQLESKNKISANEFINGARLRVGEKFSASRL